MIHRTAHSISILTFSIFLVFSNIVSSDHDPALASTPGGGGTIITPRTTPFQYSGVPSYNPGNYGTCPNTYSPNPYVPNPYVPNPYGYYYNPTGTVYSGNPYSGYVGRYNINGVSIPVYSPPQLISGNLYGINVGGVPSQYWRAPSGFYYPWVGGYGYTRYPIFVVPPNTTTPSQTLPPIHTLISDLDDYLDKAKEKGKIDSNNYQSLRLRANDLLSKEKSLAYEEGGTLDPGDEAGIRRDVEELSAEVARRVKP